ncbi:MFS general substrate transporter [Hesseltinella vesiculosa]|uniref:MFS general substrate transporter n=1 Tax=Hesseltinella vesiculosa TaxID=101127 RepID=A0A1X2GNZ0_9FUNG|nr:MFS general substrate transporter [Hesseltinella vesiculosa]
MGLFKKATESSGQAGNAGLLKITSFPLYIKWTTSPLAACIAASLILWVSFGLRQSIGIFQIPVTQGNGWDRSSFALASAMLQICWGIFQPFIVYLGETKFGHGKTIFFACLLYSVSSFVMMGSPSNNPGVFIFANALQGFAAGGNSFPIILSSVGRRIPLSSKYRNIAFGVVSGFGSMGQFCFLPMCRAMISSIGWRNTFLVFGIVMAVMSPLAVFVQRIPIPKNDELVKVNEKAASKAEDIEIATMKDSDEDDQLPEGKVPDAVLAKKPYIKDQDIGTVLKRAFTSPTFVLITLGFSVCGFHVAFLSTNLPAYLQDQGVSASLAAWVISILGIGSVVGTISTGIACNYIKPKYILTFIYTARAVMIAIFYFVELSMATIIVFAIIFGFLWLSTVPPTTRFVGDVFGNKYLGTLTSITFIGKPPMATVISIQGPFSRLNLISPDRSPNRLFLWCLRGWTCV